MTCTDTSKINLPRKVRLAVMAFTAITGLPGFRGVVSGAWMVIAFLGLAFGRSTIAG
jgi:hypothetical protein